MATIICSPCWRGAKHSRQLEKNKSTPKVISDCPWEHYRNSCHLFQCEIFRRPSVCPLFWESVHTCKNFLDFIRERDKHSSYYSAFSLQSGRETCAQQLPVVPQQEQGTDTVEANHNVKGARTFKEVFSYCWWLHVFIWKWQHIKRMCWTCRTSLISILSFLYALLLLGPFTLFLGRLCHNLPSAVVTFLFSAVAFSWTGVVIK